MATRIIYQSLALYASQVDATGVQTGAGSIAEITRVTDFNDDFNRTLTNVTVFGQLSPIDRIDLEAPTVNGSFTYFPTNGMNERAIGLTVSSGAQPFVSCISGILSKTTDSKDFYMLVTEQGSDANGYVGAYSGVIGLGNSFITSWDLKIAVGALVNSTVSLEALNWVAYSNLDGTQDIPAVNTNGFPITGVPFVLPIYSTNQTVGQVAALQYGQATINLTGDFGFGATSNNYNIQSANLTIPLARTPIQRLGSRYPFTREINFPVIATFQVEAEITGISNKNLANILCEGPQNFSIRIDQPYCAAQTPVAAFIISGKNAKVLSVSQPNTVGSNSTVTVNYELTIGSAQDLNAGVFISGSF